VGDREGRNICRTSTVKDKPKQDRKTTASVIIHLSLLLNNRQVRLSPKGTNRTILRIKSLILLG
jgi:hypothetical protein